MAHEKPRVLLLDIETKPAIVYSFGIRDQHINHGQIKEDSDTICVGLKWFGERGVTVLSEWEHGYLEMLTRTHAMLCEADAVCTYNGAKFDIPKLTGNFLRAGLAPPPPPTQIDIYRAVRQMGFISNKLDYVAPFLGLGAKVKHEGLPMWIKVMDGDPAAQKRMARYCAGDVRLLEDVYKRVLPYIRNHPHMGETKAQSCGACGSSRTQARGFQRTKASIVQRLQCQACGAWSLGRRQAV